MPHCAQRQADESIMTFLLEQRIRLNVAHEKFSAFSMVSVPCQQLVSSSVMPQYLTKGPFPYAQMTQGKCKNMAKGP